MKVITKRLRSISANENVLVDGCFLFERVVSIVYSMVFDEKNFSL